MKITRLKKGYRIRLSDSEMEALKLLCRHGDADVENMTESDINELTAGERRGLRTITGRGSWALHKDRRDA